MFRHFIFRQFLEDKEKIIRSFRSPFPFWKTVWWTFITCFLFLFIWWIGFDLQINISDYHSMEFYFVSSFSILYFWRSFQLLRKWYTQTILMTTESLIFVDWNKFFSPKSVRLDYWEMDDIEVEKTGFWSYITNFGRLTFSKVEGGESLVFDRAYRPHIAEKIISAHKERMLDEKNFTEESALKDLLSQMVQTHVRKNGQPKRPNRKEETPSQKNSGGVFAKFFKKHEPQKNKSIVQEFDDEGGVKVDL